MDEIQGMKDEKDRKKKKHMGKAAEKYKHSISAEIFQSIKSCQQV